MKVISNIVVAHIGARLLTYPEKLLHTVLLGLCLTTHDMQYGIEVNVDVMILKREGLTGGYSTSGTWSRRTGLKK